MALNSDFKVKDSLYVGSSACFVVQTDTPRILSAGTDLWDTFLLKGQGGCALTNGTGIGTLFYSGSGDTTISVDSVCNTTWNSAYTTTQSNSANWNSAYNWCTTNGNNVIDGVAEGSGQGQIAVTNVANTTTQVDVAGVRPSDSPTFAGLALNGALTTNSTIDGRDVACDGTTLDVLQSLSGDNSLTFSSPSQGTLRVTEADGDTTDIDLGVELLDSPQFVNICATGNIAVNGTVDGRDILADGTTTDALQLLSGANIASGSSPSQGTVRLTSNDGTNTDIDTGLQTGDTPAFAGVCADNIQIGVTGANEIDTASGNLTLDSAGGNTIIDDNTCISGTLNLASVAGDVDNTVLILNSSGNVTSDEIDSRVWGSSLVDGSGTANKVGLWADGNTIGNSSITQEANGSIQIGGGLSATSPLSGDGSGLTGVTASAVNFPTINKNNLDTLDRIFIQDNSDSANKHIAYGCFLVDLAGTNMGLEVDSADSLALKNYSNITDNNVAKWDAVNGQFVDSIISENDGATLLTIDGGLTVMDNLSVLGTFTCIDTSVSVTSALSVINTGTGPAFYAEQSGAQQPIAKFVDTEGGQTVIGDTGNVGIGIIGEAPGEKLTVSGNLSANGTMKIDGTSCLGGDVTLTSNLKLCGTSAGTDNTVLVQSSDGTVVTDEIDSKVWDGELVDGEGTLNKVPKYTNGTGTIGDSNISDSGTLVTIDSDTKIDANHALQVYATGGTRYVEEKTFTATVDSTVTGVTTFAKAGLKSVKYEVTLINGVNITAFEVHAVYNGTGACGTTYAIVDAQAASQLDDIAISVGTSTIDLDITAAADGTTAVIHGVATY